MRVVGKLIEAHYEKDEHKFKSYAEFIAEAYNEMDCCFDGTNFIYWDDRKPIGWKKVDIFGKIYAWKYQEELPEPPRE